MTGWLHERERLEDALYVVGFFLLGVLLYLIVPEVAIRWNDGPEPSPWALLGLLAVAALGHTQRRVRPVLGLAIACGVLLAMVQLGSVPLAMMMLIGDLLYCSVLYSSERLSWTVAGATVAVAGGAGLVSLVSDGGRAAVLVILNLGLVLAVPVLWGREVRLHRGQADAERERAEQASRMSELDRAAAVAAERARMARDLHDVIAGQLSGIAIQSEAALNLPDPDPAVLRRVLQSVRRDSVASLAEMRTMIGLLRADGAGDGDPRTAPAGLDRLDALVESAGGTGLRIEVDDARGGAAELPAAVDLAAFRIVQESLTNAAKHAPASRVRLHLGDHDGELVIEIENDLMPGAPAGGGTGTGLVGLHERAVAVGGTVTAGPDGGRWRVRAVLPVPAAAGASR
ncbi:two-component sensor histidine kinase [Pseudonocardia sp. DSM 110487]|uniref:sensor histidine kinase n=1 Tax=Pseudonocardia sp. DSM 110487 TaxID=2865833 RepID=UPI001C6A69CC|nr:histidine kinase [Pseudonocardia sp. DSM 110487]QYN35358.1 two-component sensor histidine kinase [Pseudonocardia sp. DSM 110487]